MRSRRPLNSPGRRRRRLHGEHRDPRPAAERSKRVLAKPRFSSGIGSGSEPARPAADIKTRRRRPLLARRPGRPPAVANPNGTPTPGGRPFQQRCKTFIGPAGPRGGVPAEPDPAVWPRRKSSPTREQHRFAHLGHASKTCHDQGRSSAMLTCAGAGAGGGGDHGCGTWKATFQTFGLSGGPKSEGNLTGIGVVKTSTNPPGRRHRRRPLGTTASSFPELF